MTTYTVIDHDKITSGLTEIEAARILLTDDSAEYEIRLEKDEQFSEYTLWTRKQVANKPWGKTIIFTLAENAEEAEAEIARKVLASGAWEKDDLHCVTDEQHAEMLDEEMRHRILDADSNDHDGLVAGIRHLYNCEEATVDEIGDIWIERPMSGHWLDRDGWMRVARAIAHGDI